MEEGMKNEEGASRAEFIRQMFDLNAKIRQESPLFKMRYPRLDPKAEFIRQMFDLNAKIRLASLTRTYARISIIQDEISSVGSQVEGLKARISIIQDEISSVGSQVEGLKARISIIQDEISSVGSQVEGLKARISIIQDEISSVGSQVEGLKARISIIQDEISSVGSQVEGLKARISIIQDEISSVGSQVEGLKARISIIQDEISSVGSQVEGLKNEEGASRAEFIRQMFDLNAKIRQESPLFKMRYPRLDPKAEFIRQMFNLNAKIRLASLTRTYARISIIQDEISSVGSQVEGLKARISIIQDEISSVGSQVEGLKARISIIQDEISSVGSQVEGLKNEEGASRAEFIRQMFDLNAKIRQESPLFKMRYPRLDPKAEFIRQMFDLNAKIRKFQEEKCIKSQKKSSIGTTAEPDRKAVKRVVTEVELRALEDILAHVASQTTKEEQEYIAEENIQNQVQEYIDLQRKVSLMEAMVKETKALQDLTRYPYQHYSVWNWLSGHD
ncbi:hypothetical protein NC651_036870 [Populus alba x Populus x berolinensis]|nr:hypothetical protein NC651_036870 [Populus alba x Populus x berolinensis]